MSQSQNPPLSIADQDRGHILIVDDSRTSRTWARLFLERAGYAVREAESAGEALQSIQRQPPDLILLDVILPDMDGFDVTRRLRRTPDLATIPIVLVTALGDVESKVRGLEAGANDFLTKPPEEAELLARVRTLLRLKRNQEELLAEKNRTTLLYQISRELSAELDLDSLLSRILELTIESLDATRGSIILLDPSGGVLRNIYSHQGKVTSVTEMVRGRIIQDGLAGWVIRNQQGAVLSDVQQDPRWVAVENNHAVTRSVLTVPLIYQERVTGVLTLTHEEVDRFTSADFDLLSSIASQAAIVIEKARVYLREQLWARKLQVVSGVGHQVTSILDSTQLLEDVAWLIRQTFDYYYVELALLEGDTLILGGWSSGRDRGTKTPQTRLALSEQGIIPWVASNGQPLLAKDVHQEPRYRPMPELTETAAELAVPLRVAGETLGVLDVQSDRYDQLSEEDIPLLEILASQIAIALSNARLFETVERERSRMEAILRGTDDVIIAIDSRGRITLLNPAAEQAFGLSFEQSAGQPLSARLTNRHLLDAFRQTQQESPPSVTAEIPLPDGRTFFSSISPVTGATGESGSVAVMQDISHLKELDRMKSEFVSTVSHDLRSPLTTIRGFADLLIGAVGAEHQEFVGHIKSSALQMAELIEDLLDLGKIEAGIEQTRIPCRLEELAREAVQAAEIQAQLRDLNLVAEIPPSPCIVRGDPQQLRQVLDNFLSNALKYTPRGGTITVQVAEKEDRVMVQVRDTGIGIPREAIPRLFERFYRVPCTETDEVPGTGLGLAIVKMIIDQHGGQVWVESELEKGSTFAFALQCDHPANALEPPKGAAGEAT